MVLFFVAIVINRCKVEQCSRFVRRRQKRERERCRRGSARREELQESGYFRRHLPPSMHTARFVRDA